MKGTQTFQCLTDSKVYPDFLTDRERFLLFGGIDPQYSAGDTDKTPYEMKPNTRKFDSTRPGSTGNPKDTNFSHFFCIFFGHIFRIIHAIFCVGVALLPNIELFWFSLRFIAESTVHLLNTHDVAEFLMQSFVFAIRICIVGIGLLVNLGLMFYPLLKIFDICFKIEH